jgi:RNA polymerase primary sigma factor
MRTATRPSRSGSSRSSLDIYLEQINRHELLDREEELELARAAASGDASARERLIRANLRFVVSIARRYARNGVPLEDLINDGNIGLMRAAERFDPERGFKFISYAVWWVRQAILNSLSKNSRLVRLPLNRAGLVSRVGKASRELETALGRDATPEEIAERLGIEVSEVLDAIEINGSHVSLDEKLGEDSDDHPFLDYLEDTETPAPDAALYRETLKRDMGRAVASLPDRERTIITLYYGLGGEEPITLEEIGNRMGYTRERIRQLKELGLEKLRTTSRSEWISAYGMN